MKRYGIVSYNMHCNFTNYGSALQTYALNRVSNELAPGRARTIVMDYCPDCLADKDVLNPMGNMWDLDAEARRLCELTLPAIRLNAAKFDEFYRTRCHLSEGKYTSANFDESLRRENLDGYIVGSDTVFCIDEFGFDDGFYANYPAMRGRSAAYAASFGDATFTGADVETLDARLHNFRALGIRESALLPLVAMFTPDTDTPVAHVLDPTLLLTAEEYEPIIAPPQEQEPYLLLYSRRYNPAMEEYAERQAAEHGWKVVEISLRADNARRHTMRYDAGVEEFLSLVKHAQMVVTNSYHGMIFAVQFRRPFVLFTREQCSGKITELLDFLGIEGRLFTTGCEAEPAPIDYEAVHRRIAAGREGSREFLRQILTQYLADGKR